MPRRLSIRTKKGFKLWRKAKEIIPGGNQLLSKRSEMFLPGLWPSYYSKAKGVEVWDLDGNKYTDMSIMGIGSCILGYADKDVDNAVKKAIDLGSASTLNCPEEVELAELLCKLHPWSKKVRFARSGGEAMAIAVRIARAYSGRDKVAFCGYHGWSDWYLAANLASDKNLDGHLLPGLDPKGVPRGLLGTAIPFKYNDISSLEKIFKEHKDIGTIIIEPLRHDEPENDFLKKVREIANKKKAVLIFDEITIAWRLNLGGVHLLYNINPDIAVFAKAMANGFPMAAIIGRKNVMEAAQETFISSTNWTERTGPVAALATIKKISELKTWTHLHKIGNSFSREILKLSKTHGVKIKIQGPSPLVAFTFDYGTESMAVKTLFTQEMLARGFLAGTLFYVSYAHKDKHIKAYASAANEVFGIIKKAIETKQLKKYLKGPISHSGFARLT